MVLNAPSCQRARHGGKYIQGKLSREVPARWETAKYKGYTQASLDKIKQELGAN